MSHLGANESRATDEGVKTACKYFQMSAGCFDRVRAELEKQPSAAECIDTSPDALNLLSQLMLAQAQECFYEKAVKGAMKPSIVAKLAAQVGSYYDSSLKLMQADPLKGFVNKKWPPYADAKAHIFKAIAHYQLGLERQQAEVYGEQVSRLGVATRLVEEEKKKGKVPAELNDFFNQIHSLILRAYSLAVKDNNTVYHEPVLSESKLAPLDPKSMVKGLDVDDAKLSLLATQDPFGELVPFNVRKADSVYTERKAQVAREVSKNAEEQDQIAKAHAEFHMRFHRRFLFYPHSRSLNAMGLPGSIEAAESPSGVPAALLQKMSTVRIEGGVRMLNEQSELLDKVASQDDAMLKDAVAILDREEQEDAEMRTQFGNRWNRTPSHALTSALRQEAQKFIGNLDHARKSDEFVRQKLRANADSINKLSWPAEKIVAELPSDNSAAPAGGSPQAAEAVNQVKQLLAQLSTLTQSRDSLLQQLKERINKDDITQKLLQTAEAEQESLFAKEIYKFNDTIEAIKATFGEQAKLINKVQVANESFVRQRQTNTQLEQRQAALQTYELAFKMYGELKSHIKEGIQFYTKFQEIVAKFKVKCSDFAFARKTELTDLVTDLSTPHPPPQPMAASAQVPSSNPQFYNPAAAMAATPYAAPAPQAFAQASYQLVQPSSPQPQMVSMPHVVAAPPAYGGVVGAPPPYGAQSVQFVPTMVPMQQPQRPQQPGQYFVYPGQTPPGY